MYRTITASTDLTSKTNPGIAKRVTAWHFSNTVAAAVINLRDGDVAGPIVVQIQLAIGASASQAYSAPTFLTFPLGLYVQVVSGTIVGSVDLI